MSRGTGALYLDQFQALGVEGREHGDTYPPLSAEERRVLKGVSEGLFLSRSSVEWSWYNWSRGDKRAWDRVLEILASKPVKLVRA